MNLEEKYKGLLYVEKKLGFQEMTINGENVWPYIKNKVYGAMVIDSELASSYIFAPTPMCINIDKSPFYNARNHDALIINFPRCHYDLENNIIDEKNIKLINILEEQGVNYGQVYINPEREIRQCDINENIYFADEIRYLANQRDIEVIDRSYNIEEFNEMILKYCNIEFDVKQFESEIVNKSHYMHNYYREMFRKIDPKNIFLNANVAKPEVTIVAKEMGIPIYDVQYAANIPFHLGYDHQGGKYDFSPDGLLVWSRYWLNKPYYSSTIKDYKVIGKDRLVSSGKKEKTIVIISQNLFTNYFIKKTKEIAMANPNYKIFFKSHPNEIIDTTTFHKFDNVEIIGGLLENILNWAEYCVGMYSTGLFSAIELGCKTYILKHEKNIYMDDAIKSKLVNYWNELDDKIESQEVEFVVGELFDTKANIIYENLLSRSGHIHAHKNEVFIGEVNAYFKKMDMDNSGLFIVKGLDEFYKTLNDRILDIIIPTHNSEKEVMKNFASIKRQRIFKIANIYYVNDGSTDSTGELLAKIESENSNVKVFTNPSASGNCAIPRNIALENSSAPFVTFLDSDDVYFGNTIDKMFYLMYTKKVDFIKSGVIMNRNGVLSQMTVKNAFIDEEPVRFINANNTFMWTHIYKRKIMEENSLRIIEKRFEDYNFNLKYYNCSKNAIFLGDYNVVYEKNENTMSTTYNINSILDILDVHYDTISYLEFVGLDKQAKDFANRIVKNYFIINFNIEKSTKRESKENLAIINEKYAKLINVCTKYFPKKEQFEGEYFIEHVNKVINNNLRIGYTGGKLVGNTLILNLKSLISMDKILEKEVSINGTHIEKSVFTYEIVLDFNQKNFIINSANEKASFKYFYPKFFKNGNTYVFVKSSEKSIQVYKYKNIKGFTLYNINRLKYNKVNAFIYKKTIKKLGSKG